MKQFDSISVIFCGLILFTGCSHSVVGKNIDEPVIREMAAAVKVEDGISADEAQWLAQDFLIRNNFYQRMVSLQPYRIEQRAVWNRDGELVELAGPPSAKFQFQVKQTWRVMFKEKKHTFLNLFPFVPFYVDVDKKTGDVIAWGI